MADTKEYYKAILTTEGAVQKYLAYISAVDEKTMWSEGVTPPHPIAVFKAGTAYWALNLELVNKDWTLDAGPVGRSIAFRTALAEGVDHAVKIFGLRVADKTNAVSDELRTSRLVCDPKNTTLVAYVPSRAAEVRDMPRRLGFVLSATTDPESQESHPPAQSM